MTDRVCSVEGCDRPVNAHRYCRLHYERWRKHGDPMLGARSKAGPCRIDGCGKTASAHGLCVMHYTRWRNHGDPSVLLRRKKGCWICDMPDGGRDILFRYLAGEQMNMGNNFSRHLRVHVGIEPIRGPGTPCSVCLHPEVDEIDALLSDGEVSLSEIARRYGLGGRVRNHAKPEHQARRARREIAALDAVKKLYA